MSSLKMYTNGVDDHYFVPGCEPKGWTLGRSNGNVKTKGKMMYITDGVTTKKVPKDSPIPQGWKHGFTKSNPWVNGKHPGNYGKTTYTNGKTNKYLAEGEPIPEGFYEGNYFKTIKDVYTNGIHDVFVLKGETPPKGYYQGSHGRKDKSIYTDGYTKRCFKSNEVPEGWYKCNIFGNSMKSEWNQEVKNILESKSELSKLLLSLPENSRNSVGLIHYFESNYDGIIPSTTQIKLHILSHELKDLVSFSAYNSHYESDIKDFIMDLRINSIKMNYRPKWLRFDTKANKELDIYLPNYNLAIEFNGLWSHSDKPWYYHKTKTELCKNNGIQLIHIFEHEWLDSVTKNKIKDYIRSLILPKIQLEARKLNVVNLDSNECNDFLNSNHLQGSVGSKLKYGLKDDNGNLYSVMTFDKPRFNKGIEWELIRYCVDPNYKIIAGAERLFSHFIKDNNPKSIVSYCDFSKFTGQIYDKLGFKLIKNSPSYKWINYELDVRSRYQCQKWRLINEFKGQVKNIENKTENDIMSELGYFKVFDAGQGTYIKRY